MLPSMSHVSVDDGPGATTVDSYFYPNGTKKLNMRKDLERTIQSCHAPSNNLYHESMELNETNTPKPTKWEAKSIPKRRPKGTREGYIREPLFYTKKKDEKLGELLKAVREGEAQMKGIVVPRFSWPAVTVCIEEPI